eukprot:TRINITY_DN23581_c0_g2_i1.p2 TRINITY_DN23581_c0_g2~~TRINITY_DN23581_c0_g2_i1.p2  ORF type:complete len:119 (+),score=8.57 TRINITY_DN23581_c0_g2_i1:29-385(+)
MQEIHSRNITSPSSLCNARSIYVLTTTLDGLARVSACFEICQEAIRDAVFDTTDDMLTVARENSIPNVPCAYGISFFQRDALVYDFMPPRVYHANTAMRIRMPTLIMINKFPRPKRSP